MKLISWNVNGFRAASTKGFDKFVSQEDPDILCLQETKVSEAQNVLHLAHYNQYWSCAVKKGYSGTAVFSKEKPINVKLGIGMPGHDDEGRVITAEYKDYFVVTVYTPNSQRGLLRLDYRMEWDKAFLEYIKGIEKRKPVIFCGDLNVAHTANDIANPKSNYNKTAGYTQKEIDNFQRIIDSGFVDTFRLFNQDGGNYTWWGMWNDLRKRNIGWRIDYVMVSTSLAPRIKSAFILKDVMGSDHCPVGIELK